MAPARFCRGSLNRARTHACGALTLLVAGMMSCENAPPEPAVMELEPLPPIGFGAVDGPAAFGDIADLELGADTSLYVLDRLNRVVQVFRTDGAHVRTIGRRGSGPGELEEPSALAWSPTGELWVLDPGNQRYSVYGPDGGFVATYPRPGAGMVLPWPGGFSDDGSLYDVAFQLGPEGPAMWLVELRVDDRELVEVGRSALPVGDVETFTFQSRDVALLIPVPFTSQPLSRIGPDRALWQADTGVPRVYRRSLRGGGERAYGRDFEAPPVTPADREAALEAEDQVELRSLGGDAALAQLAQRIPERKPHLVGFFVDDRMRVWLMRSTARSAQAPTPIDVYDEGGTLVWTTEAAILPDPWPRVRAGLLAGVARDGLGVEYVALFRVDGGL